MVDIEPGESAVLYTRYGPRQFMRERVPHSSTQEIPVVAACNLSPQRIIPVFPVH